MNRILLTFLAVMLPFSVAETLLDVNSQQLVNGICKKTTDTKFCRAVLVKNLVTPNPSNKDLMNATLREAERFSANTNLFISTLLRNAGDERPGLQMCAEAYTIVNMAFRNALSYFNQGSYNKIPNLEDKVSKAIGICKTDFNVPDYNINPMIERNRRTVIFMDMAEIVSHMMSS